MLIVLIGLNKYIFVKVLKKKKFRKIFEKRCSENNIYTLSIIYTHYLYIYTIYTLSPFIVCVEKKYIKKF